MSTYLRDVANNLDLKKSGNQAAGTTGNTAGSACDMINDDGQCVAIQIVGTLAGNGPTLTGKIQESAESGGPWTDIPGAVFNAATSSDDLQMIDFLRTKRFLRYYSTVAGTGSLGVPLVALIGEQKKTV